MLGYAWAGASAGSLWGSQGLLRGCIHGGTGWDAWQGIIAVDHSRALQWRRARQLHQFIEYARATATAAYGKPCNSTSVLHSPMQPCFMAPCNGSILLDRPMQQHQLAAYAHATTPSQRTWKLANSQGRPHQLWAAPSCMRHGAAQTCATSAAAISRSSCCSRFSGRQLQVAAGLHACCKPRYMVREQIRYQEEQRSGAINASGAQRSEQTGCRQCQESCSLERIDHSQVPVNARRVRRAHHYT